MFINIKEKKQLAIITASVLMLLGFLLLRYIPLRSKAEHLALDTNEIKEQIDQASTQSGQLSLLREKLANLQKTTGLYETKVPSEMSLGVFLQEMATLMNNHGLTEQKVLPGEEHQAGVLKSIPITMYCKGTTSQVFDFFESLPQLDRSIRIEDISLVNDADYSGLIAMQATVIIYYFPQS